MLRRSNLTTAALALFVGSAGIAVVTGAHVRPSLLGALQHELHDATLHQIELETTLTAQLQQLPPIDLSLPPLVHAEELLHPAHLDEATSSIAEPNHTTVTPQHPSRHRKNANGRTRDFTPAPNPYESGAAPCKTYHCGGNDSPPCLVPPPLHPKLPACGAFDGSSMTNTTIFGIMGDFGIPGNGEKETHDLLVAIQKQFGTLSFILTTGDNAYWDGSCAQFHQSMQLWTDFLPNSTLACQDPTPQQPAAPHGSLTSPAPWLDNAHFREEQTHIRKQMATRAHQHYSDLYANDPLVPDAEGHFLASDAPRFFPTLGNHDWDKFGQHSVSGTTSMPFFQIFDYLTALAPTSINGPGAAGSAQAGQFYSVTPIPGVELYALNSNIGAPTASPDEQVLFAAQVSWLKASLMSSTAAFRIVYFHHPPFSTAQHDALAPWMDLPYEAWGASMVVSGHQHVYERLLGNTAVNGHATPTMPYIVNGLGGHPWLYELNNCSPYPGSQVRYNTYHGAQLVIQSWDDATQQQKLDVCMYSVEAGGTLVDHFQINQAANSLD